MASTFSRRPLCAAHRSPAWNVLQYACYFPIYSALFPVEWVTAAQCRSGVDLKSGSLAGYAYLGGFVLRVMFCVTLEVECGA